MTAGQNHGCDVMSFIAAPPELRPHDHGMPQPSTTGTLVSTRHTRWLPLFVVTSPAGTTVIVSGRRSATRCVR